MPESDARVTSIQLNTDRLRLVPLSGAHAEWIHAMSEDPEVRRYLWEGQVIPLSEVNRMIGDSEACFADRGTGFFVMLLDQPTDESNGEFVGFCGHRCMGEGEDMELLFGMQSKFWGRGFGQEAARAVLKHGFDTCQLKRVVAATDTPNQRSVQVLQRLGMTFVERKEWHGLDTVFYELGCGEFSTV